MPVAKSKYSGHRPSARVATRSTVVRKHEDDHAHHLVHAAHGAVHVWVAIIGGVFAFLTLVMITASTFAESRNGNETFYDPTVGQEDSELQILKKRVELLEEFARTKK